MAHWAAKHSFYLIYWKGLNANMNVLLMKILTDNWCSGKVLTRLIVGYSDASSDSEESSCVRLVATRSMHFKCDMKKTSHECRVLECTK